MRSACFLQHHQLISSHITNLSPTTPLSPETYSALQMQMHCLPQ
jgi:hypothetical protein